MADHADNYIAGFACVVDISNRGDGVVEQNWIRGKAFDNSAPLGPVLATPDEVTDDATIKLLLNGEVEQHSSRDGLHFNISELVEDISGFMLLINAMSYQPERQREWVRFPTVTSSASVSRESPRLTTVCTSH
jgi:2-keto-4-pentenoate hydratase/2-oxohepta-3-ene-1,7-dioic acid hydratase in catechol pathway